MKKFTAALLSAMVVIGLAGCTQNTQQAVETTAELTSDETTSETTSATSAEETTTEGIDESMQGQAGFKLIGHSLLEIVTSDGKVIYVDPYGTAKVTDKADIILVTHEHNDHNAVKAIPANDNCTVVRAADVITADGYNTLELDGVTVIGVPAYNKNHDKAKCVGYIIKVDGKVIYHSGDTDKIDEMADLSQYNIDYAFLPTDGQYNMGIDEAVSCAELIGAKTYIPMHTRFPEGQYSEDAYNAFVEAFGSTVRQGEFVAF